MENHDVSLLRSLAGPQTDQDARYTEVVDFHDLGPTGEPAITEPFLPPDPSLSPEVLDPLGQIQTQSMVTKSADTLDQDILQYLQI